MRNGRCATEDAMMAFSFCWVRSFFRRRKRRERPQRNGELTYKSAPRI